jgi:3beta-hydroxy-delta5-steroid dehydrogenase/steroid delta-isomerase
METKPYVPTFDGSQQVYLVTGGEGCLGRHLVEELIKYRPNSEIRIFARQQNYFNDPPNVRYVFGDLTNRESVFNACKGITTIFHTAAIVSADAKQTYKVNIEGTRNLLDAAKHHQVERIIYVGSITAVLNHEPIYDGDELLPYTTHPYDPYMSVKAEAERMIMLWGELNQRPVCTVRPPFLFGYGDRHMSPKLMQLLRSPFWRWRVGDAGKMHIMYAGNAAIALLMAEEKLWPNSPICGQIFNIHDGYIDDIYTYSRELARLVGFKEADKILSWRIPMLPMLGMTYLMEGLSTILKPCIRWTPPVRSMELQLVRIDNTFSIEKAKRLLGYHPVYTRDEGLAKMRPWLEKCYKI